MQNMIMVVIKNVKLVIECTKIPNAQKIPFLLQIQEVYHHQHCAEIMMVNIVSIDLYNHVYTCSQILFSEPRFSEILDLMNKLQPSFSYFTLYPDSILRIDSI